MRFCITQCRNTFQVGVTLPLWNITKVKSFGPTFPSFEAASEYLKRCFVKGGL